MVHWNENEKALDILGNKIMLEEADEPTDINWLNSANSKQRIVLNTVISIIFLCGFLAGLVYFSSILGKDSSSAIRRYPGDVDCVAISEEFGSDDKVFKAAAKKDKNPTIKYHGRGIYQCWCDLKTNKDELLKAGDESELCYTRWYDQVKGALINKLIALTIVVMNIIIQVLCQIMTRKIGFHSYNKEILRSALLIFFG
jgi:hypothetical protein